MMASAALSSTWPSSPGISCVSFNTHTGEDNPATILIMLEEPASCVSSNNNIPNPPPLPSKMYMRNKPANRSPECSFVLRETKNIWDKLFKEGYGADMNLITDNKSVLHLPVLHNIIQQSKVKHGMRYIKIPKVPYEAINAFVRFLYSSCYEEEEMKRCVLHLLVLSHCYSVPSLKRVCLHILEQGWLTRDNVIDVLQLARNCDAPRLSFICVRMVVKDFKTISSTEGWKVMKRVNPALEQELVESLVKADSAFQGENAAAEQEG